MPGARYEWSGYGGRTAYWPFFPPDPASAMPAIAPEFRANLQRILSTSRFYLRIDSRDGRQARARRRARRR